MWLFVVEFRSEGSGWKEEERKKGKKRKEWKKDDKILHMIKPKSADNYVGGLINK